VARDIQGNSYEVDTTVLPGGEEAKIRIIATDGFNTTQDDSDGTFSVTRKAPEAYISQPNADIPLCSTRAISFQGDASDLEDQSIPDAAFVWSYGSTAFGTGRK